MNYVANILVALVIATTAACVDSSAEPGATEYVVSVRAYHGEAVVNAPERALEFGQAGTWDQLSDPNGEAEDSLCACTTDECAQAWITENFGCDICVLAPCGDDGSSAGGCVACGPESALVDVRPSEAQPSTVH